MNEDQVTTEEAEAEAKEAEVTEQPGEEAEDSLTDQQKEASGHGWAPLQDYLDNGGDEDDYVGAKAFLKNYDAIKKNRSQDQEIKSLHSKLDNVGNAVAKQLQVAQDATRKEIEAELANAKDEEDFDRYDKASEALKELETQDASDEADTPAKPPVILDFIAKHPQLDETSADYDPIMVGAVNQLITEGAKEMGRDLAKQPPTDFEMNVILKEAFETAEDRLSGKPPSKGKRKAPNVQGKGKGGKKSEGKLSVSQQGMYDHLKENVSDGAAENFKKSSLEEAA